jgi:hypothetical protein
MWVIPPLLPGANRADREWYRYEVAATERKIKDIWTNVCLVTRLAQPIPPPGAILQAPLIGTITLDSIPARFSVKLRPGQLPGDVAKRAARIAVAFGVDAVEVAQLTRDRQWISIRLMEPIWYEPEVELDPVPALPPAAASSNPLGPRERRAPAGGPRTFKRGRHRTTRSTGTSPAPARTPTPSTVLGFLRFVFVDFWRLPQPPAAGPEPTGGTPVELEPA